MKPGAQKRLTIFSSPAEVRLIVRFCHDTLDDIFSEDEMSAVELAVVEAANNIIQHAYKNENGKPLQISIFHCGDHIRIELYDTGIAFDSDTITPPDFNWNGIQDFPEDGWGIFLMNKLMDEVSYSRQGSVNILKFKKMLPADKIQPLENFDELELHDRLRAENKKQIESLKKKLSESEQACNELVEELSSAYESLNLFYKLSRDTAMSAGIEVFLSNALKYIISGSKTEWAVIRMLNGENLEVVATEGICPDVFIQNTVNIKNDSNIESRVAHNMEVVIEQSPFSDINSIICMPISGLEQFLGTILLGVLEPVNAFSTADIKLFRGMADQIAISIENNRLYKKAMNAELARQEMLIATDLQKKLILKKHPVIDGLQFYTKAEPAKQVGGDYITIEKLSDSRVVVIVCDAMGKGMSASFFSLLSHMAFHSILEQQDKKSITPGLLLTLANKIMFREFDLFGMFMTGFVGIIDSEKQQLTYASAGHCQPILYIPEIGVEFLDTDDYMMGVDNSLEYSDFRINFNKGMKVLIYSDGLTDFSDKNGEIAGIEPLQKQCLELFANYDISTSCNKIFESVLERSDGVLEDDVAMIGIECVK